MERTHAPLSESSEQRPLEELIIREIIPTERAHIYRITTESDTYGIVTQEVLLFPPELLDTPPATTNAGSHRGAPPCRIPIR